MKRSAIEFWKEQGFYVEGTGGGCEALRKDLKGEFNYIYVTCADDPSIPDNTDEAVSVALYINDEWVETDEEYRTFDNSLDAYQHVRSIVKFFRNYGWKVQP